MKKQLLAAAALALVSGVAAAQSVTVYGIIDTGIYTTGTSGSTNASQTSLVQGTWLPSLFGIKGSEDLGGGLKANFNLQGDLNSVTGGAGNYTQNATGSSLFSRYATVGLSGDFGAVDLGRQIDPLFLQSFLNGVIPTHTNSLAVNGLLAYGGTNGTSTAGTTATAGAFINNAVSYKTPTVNGLNAQVLYAAGGVAGAGNQNAVTAGLVNYANGALSLSAGYEQVNDVNGKGAAASSVTAATLKKTLVGAKYTVGAVDLAAQYNSFKAASSIDANGYEIGAAYHVSGNTLVGVNYESMKDNQTGKTPQIISLKAKYDLSKRTAIWGLVSNYNKDAAATIYQGYAINTIGATSSASGFGVGVTHQF